MAAHGCHRPAAANRPNPKPPAQCAEPASIGAVGEDLDKPGLGGSITPEHPASGLDACFAACTLTRSTCRISPPDHTPALSSQCRVHGSRRRAAGDTRQGGRAQGKGKGQAGRASCSGGAGGGGRASAGCRCPAAAGPIHHSHHPLLLRHCTGCALLVPGLMAALIYTCHVPCLLCLLAFPSCRRRVLCRSRQGHERPRPLLCQPAPPVPG